MQQQLVEAENNSLPIGEAIKYLTLYLGDSDWESHLKSIYFRLSKQLGAGASDEMRKIISCAILLPVYDKSKLTEVPENLLYWCSKYQQYKERDWVKLFDKVRVRDKQIEKWREQCLSMGIVYPLEYSPITRQAFNWLYTQAKEAGALNDDNKQDIERRYRNLVYAYGGETTCNTFRKINLKKIHSWRTGYFFEKAIFDTYSVDQIMRMKTSELNKTSPKLIKQINISK